MSTPIILTRDEIAHTSVNQLINNRELNRYLHEKYLIMSAKFKQDVNSYFEEMRNRLGIGDRWDPDNPGRGRLHRRTRTVGPALVRSVSILVAHLQFLFGRAVGCIFFPSEEFNKFLSKAWPLGVSGYDYEFISTLIDNHDLWPNDLWPSRTRAMLTLLLEFIPHVERNIQETEK